MSLVFEKFDSFLDIVKKITLTELEEAKELLLTEGKDITNISDIFVSNSDEFVTILPDGTLVKVNLYIATKSIDKSYLNNITSKDLYKYHIYNCTTISKMFASGRKHRYKINNREDGTFHYKLFDKSNIKLEERENQKLDVCKFCLGQFLGHYTSDYDVENFNLKDFHKQNHSFFGFDTSKIEKGEYAVDNVYTKKWREISTQFKKQKNYTCEDCGWKASTYQQKFIHTHHQNGDKTNNGKENLRVLCIECHSNVDEYHTLIKSKPEYKKFIQEKRNKVEKVVSPRNESIPYNEITQKLFNQGFRQNTIYQKLKSNGWKVEYKGIVYQVYVKEIIRRLYLFEDALNTYQRTV